MKNTSFKIKVAMTLALVSMMIVGIFVGCSNPVAEKEAFETSQMNYEIPNKIDQLWLINQQGISRQDLTMDDVRRIIEENADFYTKDGVIDLELYRLFVRENFGDFEIIENEDDINSAIILVKICCRYDRLIGRTTITITFKK